MARADRETKDREPEAIEMRKELASKIAAHAQSPGENPTAVPGLVALPSNEADGMFSGHYEPSLTVFVQGQKARQPRRHRVPLRRIVLSPVVNRCSR